MANLLSFVHNTRTVSSENFQVAYDGEAVRDGSMDVRELSPALLSIGELIQDANRFLNRDNATVSIRVQSEFKAGSFELRLLLDQSLIETAKALFFGAASIIDASHLITALFGVAKEYKKEITGLTIYSLFELYKLMKGEKPQPGSIKIETSIGTINYQQNEYHVDPVIAQMYENDVIRAALDKVMRPVAREGIDKLEVRKGREVLNEITKEELPRRIVALEKREGSVEQVLSDTRESLLRVVTANFEKGKWTFSDGTAKFSAKLSDPVFREKLDNRSEGFYKGDVLRVILETVQTEKPNGSFRSEYIIKEVLDHRHIGQQSNLLQPPQAL
jgi:hypothetical protein